MVATPFIERGWLPTLPNSARSDKNMATQDDYIKTAFRLPRPLHKTVMEAAEVKGCSLNAEIISRLANTPHGPELTLKTIESQTSLISLLSHYLEMMTLLAKKGNPEKLDQILIIESLAKTLQVPPQKIALTTAIKQR